MVATTQMPRQRRNAPGPAQEGSAPMQLLSTKRLTDALQAGFARCEENDHPLDAGQQIDMISAFFESFADEIIEERGHRG
jgi:hypothetical protein